MTASINIAQTIVTIKKQWLENTRLVVLLMLIAMLISFFAFWTPGTSRAAYVQPGSRGTDVTSSQKINRGNAAELYENVVRNGDAVRSILQ